MPGKPDEPDCVTLGSAGFPPNHLLCRLVHRSGIEMANNELPVNYLILQRFLPLAHEAMSKTGGIWTVNELCIAAEKDRRPAQPNLFVSFRSSGQIA